MPKQVPISFDEIKFGLSDTGLKDSTVNTYIGKIKKVLNRVFPDMSVTKQVLKNSRKKIVDYIKTDAYKNANTRKVALMAICHLYTLYGLPIDYFEKFVVDFSRLADAEAITNTSSDTIENIKNIDFEAIRKSIPTTKDNTDRLIKAFYSLLPPLRQQDLINIKVFPYHSLARDYKKNMLIIKSHRLIIKEHKTDRIHGEKVIHIPAALMKEIKLYMKKMDTDILFPFSSSGFTRRMNRLFGCSTSTFRKAYVSKIGPTLTAEERAKVAQIMGHRISTSMISYNKDISINEKDLKKEESESENENEDQE